MDRLYLDNAATSWPKPDVVYDAVDRFQRQLGASAGRGLYHSAQQASRLVTETRAACARLLGIADTRQLLFTANGTAALNLAIHGLLSPGDHVVTTVCEHNSILRPLHWQVEQNSVQVTQVGCDAVGFVDPAAIAEAISPKTRLIAVTHASNVTGAIQPIAEIAQIAHDANAFILVDAAQTAGCVPVDVAKLDIDLLACGGHKGLLGPTGTGLLYLRPELNEQLHTLVQGGSGTDSLSHTPPDQLPEKYEAGSLNTLALAGLGAAAKYLEQQTVAAVQAHHNELTRQLLDGLAKIPTATVFGPTADQPRVAVVSCTIDGYDPQEFAAALDASCGIECRAGLHCAPRMHTALGTANTGGTLRLSPGWSTTAEDIGTALEAIAALASMPVH
ncbi:MAG: aminotransferase class V-fold PLP-dependent enzyme [Planctomycetes bacterium]|nr:aminotransferase class V-fold PLP-dependent enzyme [Planctomycetota bacterium]